MVWSAVSKPRVLPNKESAHAHYYLSHNNLSPKHEEFMMSKTWLVTGSARGLGRHIAEAVLAAGDNLVATARDPSRLSNLQDRYDDHIRVDA